MKKQEIKIKYNKPLIIVMVIVLLALIFVLYSLNNQEKENDLVCVKQQISCCSCSSGGQEICMKMENVSYWQDKLKECDKYTICPALYSCKNTKCEFENGNCKEVEI